MPISKTIQRELEVAFSKQAQPLWLRITKYMILATFISLFWRSNLFWIILAGAFGLALAVHLWFRYKTKAWTKSYGGWKYDKNLPKNP